MSVDLSVAVAQDIGFVSSDRPCSRDSQLSGGWSCFRARGDQYHGTPSGGRLPAGPAAGPTRLLVGVELPFDAIAVGARLGWAFRGIAPPSDGQHHALPFGGELTVRLKLAAWSTFRLDLLGLVGARLLDAHATIGVTEDRSVPPSSYQLDNPDQQTLDGYRRMGTGFFGAGLAATFTLASWSALRFELPVSTFFPSPGVALSPAMAWVVTP
jgi:hypothetical protein